MPDFYQKIKLSSGLIIYFQFEMVLREDFYIFQRYIIGEDISNLGFSEKNFLRYVS